MQVPTYEDYQHLPSPTLVSDIVQFAANTLLSKYLVMTSAMDNHYQSQPIVTDFSTTIRLQEPDRSRREYLQITWLASTYALCIVAKISYGNAGMVQLVVYAPPSLHILAEAIGERPTSLIAIAVAIIVSLCDVYTWGSIVFFTSCLIATFLGVLVFSLAAPADQPPSSQGLKMSKIFVAISLLFKSLLEHDTTPASNDHGTSAIQEIQSALFIESFSFSIMALWLLASGVPVVNPAHREFYSLVRTRPSALAASILCWTGVSLLIAVGILNLTVSPPEVHIGGLRRVCHMRVCGDA